VKSVASRASQKLPEDVKSVASRASQKLLDDVKDVASRASEKLPEDVKSVASRASEKLPEKLPHPTGSDEHGASTCETHLDMTLSSHPTPPHPTRQERRKV